MWCYFSIGTKYVTSGGLKLWNELSQASIAKGLEMYHLKVDLDKFKERYVSLASMFLNIVNDLERVVRLNVFCF